MNRKKKFVIGCYFIMLGLLIWGYIIFLTIYFNGNSMMIYVNRYNEADLELVVIPVLIFCCVVGLYFLVKERL